MSTLIVTTKWKPDLNDYFDDFYASVLTIVDKISNYVVRASRTAVELQAPGTRLDCRHVLCAFNHGIILDILRSKCMKCLRYDVAKPANEPHIFLKHWGEKDKNARVEPTIYGR